jgi:hypothetical protein
MQSISILHRIMKAGHWVAFACGWLALAVPAQAGQYQLLAGQPNSVLVAARVQNAEQVCNLEISIQGQASVEREVQAPFFEARIDITPQDVESVAVTWRGKFKRVNDVAINACPTQGRTQFAVVEDNATLRAGWRNTFMAMDPTKAQCVRTALQLDRVRYEWFDMADREVSPEDRKIQRAMSRCDDFVAQKKAWGEQNAQNFPCTLPGGLKTRCEGFFTATEKGKAVPITTEAVIRRQLDQQPWGTGVRETSAAKAGRQKQERARQAQLLAEEAAKVKAEEEARLREVQLALEAKAAQARERKEKAEAERAKRLKEIERKEEERLAKRSWLLKQLEKLKSDPKADGKAEEGKAKDDKPAADKPKEDKAEPAKPEVKLEASKPEAPKPEALKPEAAKPEAAKSEAPKVEPAKPEAAAPKEPPAKEPAAQAPKAK